MRTRFARGSPPPRITFSRRMTPVAFSPRRCRGPGETFQPHPHDLDHGVLVRVLDQGAFEPIVVAHEFRGEQRGGLSIKLDRRSLLLDQAAIEQGDAVGDRHRLDLIVGHQQGGEFEGDNEVAEPGTGLLAQFWVEIG